MTIRTLGSEQDTWAAPHAIRLHPYLYFSQNFRCETTLGVTWSWGYYASTVARVLGPLPSLLDGSLAWGVTPRCFQLGNASSPFCVCSDLVIMKASVKHTLLQSAGPLGSLEGNKQHNGQAKTLWGHRFCFSCTHRDR